MQKALPFTPEPIRVARPPHNPALVRRLCRAALGILGLLGDGLPHSRRELEAVGGNRYIARLAELRRAGHHVLGPRPWRDKDDEVVWETEALGPGKVERYRLVIP